VRIGDRILVLGAGGRITADCVPPGPSPRNPRVGDAAEMAAVLFERVAAPDERR
jgi:hypothetical protein